MLLAGAIVGPVGVVDDGRMVELALGASLCVSEVGQLAHVGGQLLGSYGGGRESPEGAAGDVGGVRRAQDRAQRPRDCVFGGHGGGCERKRWWCGEGGGGDANNNNINPPH